MSGRRIAAYDNSLLLFAGGANGALKKLPGYQIK
jgi:hypothetical protein